MNPKLLALAGVWAAAVAVTPAAQADPKAIAIDEMASLLEFSDYGGGVIFPQQIPREQWSRLFVIDARDAGQYAKGHIPGAVNIEWRQVLARRHDIPRDRMVLIYCNTGSLSAQAGFALRVAGWDNVRILQGGLEAWRAAGGFDAAARADAAPGH